MSFQQSFGTCDISSKFLRSHQAHHRIDPSHEIAIIAEETLQIVRVQQFLLPAVCLCRELGPLFIDLFLLGVGLVSGVRVRLHQPIGRLVQLLDFVPQSGQIALESLVLPLQRLHAPQVLAKVVVVQRRVFLADPVLGLVDVPMEALNLVRGAKLARAFSGQRLQTRPFLVEVLDLGLDLESCLGLPKTHQLHRDLVHLGQSHFVRLQIGLEVVEFLLHDLDLLQILADVLDLGVVFLVLDPGRQFRGFANEDVGLGGLVELVLALASEADQVVVLRFDLSLAGGDGALLFGEILLRGAQTGVRVDALDVRCWDESLPVEDIAMRMFE